MCDKENPGLNVRDWLHVKDNCRAIWFLSQKGVNGEIYNISGDNEVTNTVLTEIILSCFGVGKECIDYVPHRLGHDFRYSINDSKLKELGFKHNHRDLNEGIKGVGEWYKENKDWWGPLK